MTAPLLKRAQIPEIIGHRGACGHAPENTVVSFRKAAEIGVKCIEFDVMLSLDNHPLIYHDDDLERTCRTPALMASTPLSELRSMDAGSWFDEAFTGEPIPDLATAINVLEELGMNAVIEIKPSEGRDLETGRIASEYIRDNWPPTLPIPIISSFSEIALHQAKNIVPTIPRALNVDRDTGDWLERLEALECEALHAMHDNLTERAAKPVIEAGYDLRCFTVNDPDIADRLFHWGTASIFTDFPDRMMKWEGFRTR